MSKSKKTILMGDIHCSPNKMPKSVKQVTKKVAKGKVQLYMQPGDLVDGVVVLPEGNNPIVKK